MKHIYWVGIKESEIQMCSHLFEGSITFIGSGKCGNISFSASHDYIINYNEDSLELDNFMRESLHTIIEKVPDVSFLCYTASYIYSLEDPEISSHIICGNNRDTLRLLRNKMNCRLWLNKYVPVLPTVILTGSECLYEDLQSFFPDENIFTLQGCTGAGGIDTFVMTFDTQKYIQDRLSNNCIYLVSPYQTKSYSVNIHVLFAQNDYYITPGSIQIVEFQDGRLIYRGADFIEYRNIPLEIQNKIIESTKIIAEKVQLLSYNGVLGIDYLICGSKVYFLEINPRFQSSTSLLNLALKENGLKSIQEMLLEIFYKKTTWDKNILMNINVNYSNYIIDYESEKYNYSAYLKNIKCFPEIAKLVIDGYRDNMMCQRGASIFSVIFEKNIISLNPNGTYNIYDNIRPFPLKEVHIDCEDDCKWLKFAIMNQGVCFLEAARKQIVLFQKGVYSSLDIYITENFIINAPTEIPFHELSPFKIDSSNNQLTLFYGEKFITNISICKRKDYCDQETTNGINFRHISFIATDRLRIHHSPNCLFQSQGTGCKFCDISGNSVFFGEKDIKEVIDWHLSHSEFRHILIGGASGNYPKEYMQILKIVKYIRENSDKEIYLMTLPPVESSELDQYHAAGVNEVAFNIEIFDRNYARKIMPGKGQISLENYQNALLHSVKLWGNTGNVRSLLIYGLEPDSSFLDGVEWLAMNGIQPIISPLRALNGTHYENIVPPTTQNLIDIYNKASEICNKYHLHLGPDCIYCQNNTLSFTFDVCSPFDN